MAVRIQKPAVNFREKLAELERPIGVNGQALMATDTPQQAFDLIGAGRRNLIINGGMVFNQRGIVGGSSNAGTSRAGGFGLDRWTVWRANDGTSGAVIQEQSTDVPSGQYFKNSLKLTINGSGNPTANTSVRLLLHQMIEGNNMYQLQYGTSSARFFTFSFWVKCSVAGLYAVTFTNNNSDRGYVATYSINSASTWEYKTITVPGDTTGTWTTDNTAGLTINFDLGTNGPTTSTYNTWLSGDYRGGATTMKLNDKSGSTYFITGVQLEEGKIATPFEFRSHGQELALCQRYCHVTSYDSVTNPIVFWGYWSTSTIFEGFTTFPVTMRTSPTLTIPTIGSLYALEAQVAWRQISSFSANESGPNCAKYAFTAATNASFTKGQGGAVGIRAAGTVQFSSEL
jgi:hypothetical protein